MAKMKFVGNVKIRLVQFSPNFVFAKFRQIHRKYAILNPVSDLPLLLDKSNDPNTKMIAEVSLIQHHRNGQHPKQKLSDKSD